MKPEIDAVGIDQFRFNYPSNSESYRLPVLKLTPYPGKLLSRRAEPRPRLESRQTLADSSPSPTPGNKGSTTTCSTVPS